MNTQKLGREGVSLEMQTYKIVPCADLHGLGLLGIISDKGLLA